MKTARVLPAFLCVVLLAPAVRGDEAEDKKSAEKYGKQLLDPKDDKEFFQASNQFFDGKLYKAGGEEYLKKAADKYAAVLKDAKAEKKATAEAAERFPLLLRPMSFQTIDPKYVPALLVLAEMKEAKLRKESFLFLGKIGDKAKDALPALKKIRDNDPDKEVVAAAKRAIESIEEKK
jgi:hypothetical protein